MPAKKLRVVAAGIGGLAAAYAQIRRLTRDEALERIQLDLLAAKLDDQTAAAVLADAAASYVNSEAYYAGEALQLLVDAGADVDEAGRIRAERDGEVNPLGFIAAQANRPAQPG